MHVNVRSVGVGRGGSCMLCTFVSDEGGEKSVRPVESKSIVYYESMKRELKTRPIYENTCCLL